MNRKRCRKALAAFSAVVAMTALSACANAGGAQSEQKPQLSTQGNSAPDAIKVGFLEPSIGDAAVPAVTPGRKGAVDYINNELGGIGGRPLQLVVCPTDGTPEKGVSCANSLVRQNVVAVLDGTSYSASAALPILQSAGIPLIGAGAQTGEVNQDAKGVYYIGVPLQAFAIGQLQSFAQQRLNSAALTLAGTTPGRDYVESFVEPVAQQLGMQFTPVFYPPDNPNFSVVAQTIVARNPAIGGAIDLHDEQACISLIESLRSAGFDSPIYMGFCTQFLDELSNTAGIQISSTVWLPRAAKYADGQTQQELKIAQAAVEAAAKDPSSVGWASYETFSQLVTFTNVLETIKSDITTDTVRTTFENLRDFPRFLGPEITCGGEAWQGTSACSNKVLQFKVQRDESLKPVGGAYMTVRQDLEPTS